MPKLKSFSSLSARPSKGKKLVLSILPPLLYSSACSLSSTSLAYTFLFCVLLMLLYSLFSTTFFSYAKRSQVNILFELFVKLYQMMIEEYTRLISIMCRLVYSSMSRYLYLHFVRFSILSSIWIAPTNTLSWGFPSLFCSIHEKDTQKRYFQEESN